MLNDLHIGFFISVAGKNLHSASVYYIKLKTRLENLHEYTCSSRKMHDITVIVFLYKEIANYSVNAAWL